MVAAVAPVDDAVYMPVGGCLDFYTATDPDVIAVGPAGTGKAQPLDATVYTTDGPKRMGDIALGDMALMPDGSVAPVVGIFPQGEQDVYRLTFSGGDVVECTADHLWDVRYTGGGKRNGNKVREMRAVLTVADMERDYLVGARQRPKYWIPQTAPVALATRPVSVPPYTLGMLIGDGHIRSGAITLATNDEEIVERIQDQLGDAYIVRHRGRCDYAIVGADSSVRQSPSRAKRGFVAWHKSHHRWTAHVRMPGGKHRHIGGFVSRADAERVVAEYDGETHTAEELSRHSLWSDIRDLGLTGKLSAEKFVPDRYKYNSVDVRLDVLRGLMDADGTVDRKTGMPSFCTVSRRLADDVKWLVESLGGVCTITEKQPRDGQLAYQCWIRYNDPADLFRLRRKQERCKARSKYPVKRMLLSIERVGRKACQCIRVDHPDHLYLTDHFIVTHNTMAACWRLHHIALKVPGVRLLIARKVLEDLKTGALSTYTNHVQPELDGVVPFGGNRFYPGAFRYPNGSVIHVVGLDKPGKVMSAEYDVIYCFTGDTKVESPSPIEKGYRREYSGPLVTIRTASGNELTGTPNHPILTDKGWVALGLLSEGDNVISRSRVEDERTGGNPDVEHQPATFAEVFRALSLAESSRTERVEAVGMDFHGDGADGQIDIVTTARGLRAGNDAPVSQHVIEHEFVGRDLETQAFMRHGSLRQLLGSVGESSIAGTDCRSKLAHALPVGVGVDPLFTTTIGGSAEVARPLGVNVADVPVTGGFGLAAGLESTSPQFGLDRGIADTDGRGDFVQPALPFEVAADRIVHVIRTHSDARSVRHVYNLQTADHYYIANNIIAHNCNEATELDEVTWQILKSRLRNGVLGYQQIMGDCNPAGPRHWLNVRCNAGLTRRIQTTHKDNPAYWNGTDWTPMGRSYVLDTLGSLTGAQRKRLLEGVWAGSEGLVYPEFVPEMIRAEDVSGWTSYLAVDVGSKNPTAILTCHVAGDRRVHVSHEVYRRNLSSTDIVAEIEAAADRCNPDLIYIDPSAKGTITDLIRDGYPVEPANNDVIDGIRRVKTTLVQGFSVDPSCVNLIDEFGLYAYKDNPKIETDKPVKEHDHALDAVRYLCAGITEPTIDIAAYYRGQTA